MRIGINGSNHLVTADVGAALADAVAAEQDGFTSYWLLGSALADPLTVFAGLGPTTSSIELGTAVIPTWTQHPARLAAQALTAQQMTGGRIILGIGLAHEPSVTDRFKMEWKKPIRHMLDYLDILDGLLAGEHVAHDGEIWGFEGDAPRPTDTPPKVMLAALGDQMLRLAGRRSDGTILWCVGPKTIASHIAPKINDAAAEAGRPDPAIVCSIPCWVTDDPQPARDFLAAILANYSELPSYRAMLDIEGLHGLGDLSFVGSADEVRDRIGQVADAGATDFTAVIMGGDPDEIAETRAVVASAAS